MQANLLSLLLLIPLFLIAQERTSPQKQPIELGKIACYRDFDQAKTLAEKEGKAIFILFQEVPGCATCRSYGKNVLSNPALISTIENDFIPLAIFNNKGGKDRKTLDVYKEPTWNNPVVRIVNAEGENLIPRIAGDYSKRKVALQLLYVLKKNKKAIPEHLYTLAQGIAY